MPITTESIEFLPMLIDVQLSSNYYNPGDTLWITAHWQNIGNMSPSINLKCFMELEFGYQRIPETIPKSHKVIWEPLPGLQNLRPFEIMTVSGRFVFPPLWGGTYKISIGICDDNGDPIEVIGGNNEKTRRIYACETELGWGWGSAALELIKRPICVDFNNALPVIYQPINNDLLEISDEIITYLEKNTPVVRGYKNNYFEIYFESYKPEIIVRDYKNDKVFPSFFNEIEVVYNLMEVLKNKAIYGATVFYKGKPCVELELKYEITGKILSVSIENFKEYDDFELIEVKLFSLAAMDNEQTKMVDIIGGGRLVSLNDARIIGYTHLYEVRNTAFLYNDFGMAIMEAHSLDDKIHVAVENFKGKKRCVIGATIATRVCGKKKIHSILTPKSKVDISIFSDEYGKPSWVSASKFLRKDLKSTGREIHAKAVHYEMYSSQGPMPLPGIVKEDSPYALTRLNKGFRFTQITNEIRKIYNILDGYKQVPFLYGFHKQNNEDYIPNWCPYEPDIRGGSVEELRQAIKEAEQYNTSLCLYENYDHVYPHGVVDKKFSAMDMYGKPWKGWVWADGVSIEIGFKKYVESGALAERVKKMVDIWGPRKTGYIDVLSSEALRWDFDPENPASAEISFQYRKKLIEEYNKYGTDIYSETLIHPYVGIMGHGKSTRINYEKYFEKDEYIPLMNAFYHGTITYNCFSGDSTRTSFFKGLLNAGSFDIGFVDEPVNEKWVKWAYLYQMPMGMIDDEKLEEYSEVDSIVTMRYSNDCIVKFDSENMKYEIYAYGRLVGKDWTTLIPGNKDNSMLAFSYSGGKLRYLAPLGWKDGIELKGVVLTFEGEAESVSCSIENGHINIDMPINKPVRIIPVCK